ADAAAGEVVGDEDVHVGVAVLVVGVVAPLDQAAHLAVGDDRVALRPRLVEGKAALHRDPPPGHARLPVQLAQSRDVADVEWLEFDHPRACSSTSSTRTPSHGSTG